MRELISLSTIALSVNRDLGQGIRQKMKISTKSILAISMTLMSLSTFNAEAFFGFGKKKTEIESTAVAVTVNLVGVQNNDKYGLVENYFDTSGNIRIKIENAVFGNYQKYSYVSPNGTVFPAQSWYCKDADCHNSVVNQLTFYDKGTSESCPLQVQFVIDGFDATMTRIKPQPCHLNGDPDQSKPRMNIAIVTAETKEKLEGLVVGTGYSIVRGTQQKIDSATTYSDKYLTSYGYIDSGNSGWVALAVLNSSDDEMAFTGGGNISFVIAKTKNGLQQTISQSGYRVLAGSQRSFNSVVTFSDGTLPGNISIDEAGWIAFAKY